MTVFNNTYLDYFLRDLQILKGFKANNNVKFLIIANYSTVL